MALAALRGLYRNRRVLRIMVQRDLRVRYARSVLGYLWTLIDPLAMSLVYFVIFALVFKRAAIAGYEPYFLFLLTGLLPWQWFNAAVTEGTRSLQVEARLVRSTRLPRELWVVRVVVAKGIEFLLSLPVLIVFAAVYVVLGDAHINWRLVLIPVGMGLQFVLLTGIGFLLAPIQVLAADTMQVIRIVLRVGFYATPIIYVAGEAPPVLQTILWVNPMTGILEFYRSGFFPADLQWPPIAISVAVTILVFALGRLVFTRLERSVLKEI